jgi:DHA2 family multidrug resistance protein
MKPAAPAGLTPRQWAVVITASIGALLKIIDTSITNVALIEIQAKAPPWPKSAGWSPATRWPVG